MRIFKDALEMVKEVERDLKEMGILVHPETMQDKHVADDEGYSTFELQAYGYKILPSSTSSSPTDSPILPDGATEMVEYMGGNLDWCDAEFVHRVSPDYVNPGTAYWKNLDLWNEFIRDGQFAYTYNERFREQLIPLMLELTKRPNTRQAILTMYDRHQDMNNWGGKDRVPCSMYYQFYIREERLHMVYTMRSCDFLSHFVHDVYLAMRLQRHVAEMVGKNTGMFTHFMGSLHAYKKDIDARGIF